MAFNDWFRRLRVLAGREQFDRDLQEEMRLHQEYRAREYASQGADQQEAELAARRRFGNATLLREEGRDAWGWRWLEDFFQDIRYGARQLASRPGFAVIAVLTLALGIGATTTIFSAVNPILFEPLPYPHPRSVVMLWERDKNGRQSLINFADYRGVTENSRSFEAVAAMRAWQPTMTGPDEPERLEGQLVSAPYLLVLGIQPALGRNFSDAEDISHGPNVVILSDKLWRRRFNANGAIVGRQIKLDDDLYTVIGVMPHDFENVTAPEAEIWAPLQYNATLPPNSREWGHHLRMVGRMKDGVNLQQASSELDIVMPNFEHAHASGYDEAGGIPAGYSVDSLQDDLTRDVRPALLALLGAVVLVLIIACVNVTNLLLARGAQRRGELAVRAALGASGFRLARQLTAESLLLALLGGAGGILLAKLGVAIVIALSPTDLPRQGAIRLDATAFAFALFVAGMVGLLVGLVPGAYASRTDPHDGLQQTSLRTIGGHQWTRRGLVMAEVAVALVLLVGAGLLVNSLKRLFSVDAGFDASNVITMQVQESGRRYRKDEDRRRFFEEAVRRVREVPGVLSAGFTNQLPLSGDQDVYGMQFETDDNPNAEAGFRYAVTAGYFEAMRIPLVAGRYLTEQDMAQDAPRVVVINESFARRKLPGVNPIGRRVCVRCGLGGDGSPWSTIVGVVGDVRQLSLELKPVDAVYIPFSRWYWGDQLMTLVVRTRGDAASLTPALRSAIWAVDKDQPVVRIATMQTLVTASQAQRRFAMIIFEAFALVALMLAAIGLYGVLSGSVTERTREIGVRTALGATRLDILALVLRQGMTMTIVGVVFGLAGAFAATRALVSLLFGVTRLDPITYAGVVVILLGISAVACWLPARRATRIDPMVALRYE